VPAAGQGDCSVRIPLSSGLGWAVSVGLIAPSRLRPLESEAARMARRASLPRVATPEARAAYRVFIIREHLRSDMFACPKRVAVRIFTNQLERSF
jgi:hypothetical protein